MRSPRDRPATNRCLSWALFFWDLRPSLRGSIAKRGDRMFGRMTGWGAVVLAASTALLAGCNNNPFSSDAAASNTMFSAVVESSPRHLDPTASYWSNENCLRKD